MSTPLLEVPDIGKVCATPGEYKKVERRTFEQEYTTAQQVILELGTNFFEKTEDCTVDTVSEFTAKSLKEKIGQNYQSLMAQSEISDLVFNHVMMTLATAFVCEFKKKRFSPPILKVEVTAFNPNVTYQGEGSNLDFVHRMPLGWVQWADKLGEFSTERYFIRQLKQFIPSPNSYLSLPIVYLCTGVEARFELIK